ncbi:MAG TPA: glutamine--fructose-6-phosphate transaminase (isomerizing) [Planctomycetota bacterium]|jgi:glucosamine--fructose-6-phosphate aminotransferase (isomerizing)|nr:glutamine--fructose-6-phosphate transaminase (isomerizing) [Planctomycetota bacterium]
MCGIVGALLSEGSVVESLLEGLRLLEYRGYDSAGVAVLTDGGIAIRRKEGRIERLAAELADGALSGALAGIGHTRWATHGPPSDANAHPHTDEKGRVAVVHNGIFENYLELRRELAAAGVRFASDTDTEVLAHLVGREMDRGTDLAEAVRKSLARVVGYYAVAVIAVRDGAPRLVCARAGPPLMVAVTPRSAWLASDVLALIPHAREVVVLEDGDVAELGIGKVTVRRLDGTVVHRPAQRIEWDPETAAKGTFPHFMLKEIHEQPDVLARTAFDRVREEKGDVAFETPGFDDERLRKIERISVVACGTALHAGLIARYLIEGLAGIAVDVDFASEFRYREPRLAKHTLALAISQSGETADTLAALRRAKELGARTAAICNVEGSTLVRESDCVVLTRAGPEIGVASTKAFVAQIVAAYLLALRIGRARGTIGVDAGRVLIEELRLLRPRMEQLLGERAVKAVHGIAERHQNAKGFLFLGRGINYPVALEGALKLKEISYVHAEGYAAGEMKHGPIALIEPAMSIVCVTSRGQLAPKMRSNIEQVRARGGQVIVIGSDPESRELAGECVQVPESSEWLSPALNVVPLQLLAYHMAALKGADIDKPRNLAKSVTVE